MAVTATEAVRAPPAQPVEPDKATPPKGAPDPQAAAPAATVSADDAKRLPSAVAARLTGAATHTYTTVAVTALELPGVKPVNKGPDTTVPAGGAAQAGAAAAVGTPPAVAAADAGAAAAVEQIANAQRTAETERLINKNIAAKVFVLPGDREKGISQLAAAMTEDRADFIKAHPEAGKRLQQLIDQLKTRLNGRMPEGAVVKLATLSMAREIYDINGIKGNSDRDRLVALPAFKYRMALADRVAARIVKDGNLPPDVAEWMKSVAAQMQKKGATYMEQHGLALDLLRNCVSTTIQSEAVGNMVARGELPANLSARDYPRIIRQKKAEAWQEMGAAELYSPNEVRQEVYRAQHERRPAVAYDAYRIMAHEAIQNTLSRSGDRVRFYDPATGATFSPTDQQMQAAAASYRPPSSSISSSALPTGAVGDEGSPTAAYAQFGQQRDRREVDLASDPVARSLAYLQAQGEAIRTDDARRYIDHERVSQNLAMRGFILTGVWRPQTIA